MTIGSRGRPTGRVPLGQWAVILLATAAATLSFWSVGLPSPTLFGALVAAMACALTFGEVPALPARAFTVGQALIGATIGSLVTPAALRGAMDAGVTILFVTATTLLLSVVAGRALGAHPDVDATTGAFALVAGGASGMTSIARGLGADERVVTVVQYLRVLLVLLTLPVVAALVHGPASGEHAASGHPAGWQWSGLVLATAAVAVGLPVARVLRIPAGPLLGPLAVAVALSASGLVRDPAVPAVLQNVAYLLIGLQVGLRFTRSSLRSIARILPAAVVLIVTVILGCAGLGWLLTATTDVSAVDAYLATTPGGLYAVLATAVSAGSDITFVLATQVTRVLLMLVAAPLLARLLQRRQRG